MTPPGSGLGVGAALAGCLLSLAVARDPGNRQKVTYSDHLVDFSLWVTLGHLFRKIFQNHRAEVGSEDTGTIDQNLWGSNGDREQLWQEW